jgi:hypothetical protein
MNRSLTSDRFPFLPIRIGLQQRETLVEGLVDTGFDGYVAVPEDFPLVPSDPPDLAVECILADDSVIVAPAYYGTV